MSAIFQAMVPPDQQEAARRKLPGTQPVGRIDWLTIDDAYTAQLQKKADLMQSRRDDILRAQIGSQKALEETLDEILVLLEGKDGFDVTDGSVTRPDGVTVSVQFDDPLFTLSQLVQEDICLMQKRGDEHVLTAALLAFPASWTLGEKIGRPLTGIHTPVPEYDNGVAARVQRLFDGVQVGRPLWRANLFPYVDPDLYHPRSELCPRREKTSAARFIRSERQTVWRLPKTRDVVFAIHTSITNAA